MTAYPIIPASEVQIRETSSVLDAMRAINRTEALIALVVNDSGKLLGSLTDGDIRRGLLSGIALDAPVGSIMHANPYIMPASVTRQQLIHAMHDTQVKQMPLIESDGTLKGIALYDMITGFMRGPRSNPVVIMAGGKGKRLLPITRDVPKPMVEVAGKPMLEHILSQFIKQGFTNFHIAINYLGHMIEEYFGDGAMWKCTIQYIREEESLGTAGALSLLPEPFAEPFILINGDILSAVEFGELIDYHGEHQAAATLCARTHRTEVPFGVVQLKDGQLEAIVEKPVYENLISAGIYVLSPEVLAQIPKGKVSDMPTVLQELVQHRKKVAVFSLREDWVDVGRLDDLVSIWRKYA